MRKYHHTLIAVFALLAGFVMAGHAARAAEPQATAQGQNIAPVQAALVKTEPAQNNTLGKIIKYFRADDGSIVVVYDKVTKTISLKSMDEFSAAAHKKGMAYPLADTEKLALSEDGLTLGWLVRYDACYSSYPCPWVVALYRDGKIIQKIQGAQFIWDWRFNKNAEQVAVRMEFPQDSPSARYALFDVSTGRVVAKASAGKTLPSWAHGLKEKE